VAMASVSVEETSGAVSGLTIALEGLKDIVL
jgi:hypothetical protein